MFAKTSYGGHTTYDLASFVVDTVADIDDLPIDVAIGSTVLVVENSSVYILNNSREWKEI